MYKYMPKLSKGELYLRRCVKALYPDRNILYNLRPDFLINPSTGGRLELDIYIPELALAFEYQGEQHYFDPMIIERDCIKVELCLQEKVQLVHVPYGWKNNLGELKSQLKALGVEVDDGEVSKPAPVVAVVEDTESVPDDAISMEVIAEAHDGWRENKPSC